MNTNLKEQTATREGSRPVSAEQRLIELGIKLPAPPEPFGTYAEAVQTGNLLFLTGMLPTEGREAKFIGRVGAELDVETGRKAAHLAALNVLAVAQQHLGSLDKVTRIVRLGVSVATSGDVREQPKVADGASELLQDVFGKDENPCRLMYGVARLPLGTTRSHFRSRRLREKVKVNDAAFQLVLLEPMLAGLPRGVGRFRDAHIISIAGATPRKGPTKGTSHGTPDFLSHDTGRWALHLL